MASNADDAMVPSQSGPILNISLSPLSTNENSSIQYTFPTAQHPSPPEGCVEAVFREREFLPWDNPDNIVSAAVESVTSQTKTVLLAFFFLIGAPGNVINMAVFFKEGLKDRVNLCLFALALADELYLITAIIYNGEQLVLQFTSEKTTGPVKVFLTNNHFVGLRGFGYISYVLSAIIASERCYCVLRPLTYQTLMRTRTMAAIIIVVYFLMAGLYFIAVGFRFSYGCSYDPATVTIGTVPIMGDFYREHREALDFIHVSLFGVGLPMLVIVVVIVMTVITAVRLRQVLTWRAGTAVSISPREVALTKMLIGTSVLFIVCVVPTALARNVTEIFPEMDVGGRNQNFFLAVVWISQVFTYMNASLNIFVYYIMGSRYRETFWSFFGRCSNSKAKVMTDKGTRVENTVSKVI